MVPEIWATNRRKMVLHSNDKIAQCILVMMAQLLVQLFCGLLIWFIAAGSSWHYRKGSFTFSPVLLRQSRGRFTFLGRPLRLISIIAIRGDNADIAIVGDSSGQWLCSHGVFRCGTSRFCVIPSQSRLALFGEKIGFITLSLKRSIAIVILGKHEGYACVE